MGIVIMWLVLRRRRRAGDIHDQRSTETRAVAYERTEYGGNPAELGHATPQIDGVNTFEIDGLSTHEMEGRNSHHRHKTYVRQNTSEIHTA